MPRSSVRRRPAFTLIELLVVVAIIALLIAILLPSLNSARAQAKAVYCGSNLGQVGKAVGVYLAENRGVFPLSYDYVDQNRQVDLTFSSTSSRKHYLHWSDFLYQAGQVDAKSFQCPEFLNGGMPRTNPGPLADAWPNNFEFTFKDESGKTKPANNAIQDFQAPWMAYGTNAAIIPRNKYEERMAAQGLTLLKRHNIWVNESKLNTQRRIVLAAEYSRNPIHLLSGDPFSGDAVMKAHRPLDPFASGGVATNDYIQQPKTRSIWGYLEIGESDPGTYGIVPDAEEKLASQYNLIGNASRLRINAIGRHHPGGDEFGGTTNFLFVDGGVGRKTVFQTMENREWGDRYYSLTGANRIIINPTNQPPKD